MLNPGLIGEKNLGNKSLCAKYCKRNHELSESRGLILGRIFVLVPSSFAVKSLGLGVQELKIQSLSFRVRELKKL